MIVVPPIIGREVVASSGVGPGIDVVTQVHLESRFLIRLTINGSF